MKRITIHVRREVTTVEYARIHAVVDRDFDIRDKLALGLLLDEWESQVTNDIYGLWWEEGLDLDEKGPASVYSAEDRAEDPLLDPRDAKEDEYISRAALLEHQTGSIHLDEPGVPPLFGDDKETTS